MDRAAQCDARRAKFWPAALIDKNQGISPTHTAGVGTVGVMDVESDESSNGDLFRDAENDMVLDADGPDAAEEAFNDGTADGEPVEEAPMRLPRNPSDPRLKREKSITKLTCRTALGARCA